MSVTRADRIAGCLLGGALGDAIGAAFEGMSPPVDFAVPKDLLVTDDTQLTLATCEAIIATERIDPESISERFVVWFRQRRLTGVGASTLKALRDLDAGGHWALVGATGERSAGNGAAMRMAPLAFWLDPELAQHRQRIRDVCRITHRNEEAYIGALAILRTLRHALAGGELDHNFHHQLCESLPDSRVADRLKETFVQVTSATQYAERFTATGYVVDAVPLAILAATQAVTQNSDYLTMIQTLVACGGDTDSIAAMAGQIYGAMLGKDRIPADLSDRIDLAKEIRNILGQIAELDTLRNWFD